MSSETAAELYLLRGAVEGPAARLAASRIQGSHLDELRRIHGDMERAQAIGDVSVLAISSRRVHAVIAEAGGPAFIAAHLRWIWETYPVPTADSVWQVDEVAGRGIAEHGALLDVLERGDADSAERIMTEHIAHTRLDRHAQRDAALLDAQPHT